MWTLTIVNGIAYGSLLFLIAAGFSLIFGVLKVINLAQGTLYLAAAYLAISLSDAGLGAPLSIILAALFGALLGVAAERLVLYRLQGQYLTQVLVTLGFLHIFADIFHLTWGGTPMTMATPEWLNWSVPIGLFGYPAYRLFLVASALTVFGVLLYLEKKTAFGWLVKASVDDEEIARASGIGVGRLRWVVFGLGGLLAGIAGGIGAPFLGARPGLDLEIFLLALVIVVIGGTGSLPGALIAAILVGLIDSIGKVLLPELSMFLLFLPLVLILLFKPAGLFGLEVTSPVIPVVSTRKASSAVGNALSGSSFLSLLGGHSFKIIFLILTATLLISPAVLSNYSISVVMWFLIWATAGVGFNFLLGYAGLPSFGHAAFFGAGAFSVVLLSTKGDVDFMSSILLSVVLVVTLAILFGVLSIRTKTVYFLLTTLALGQVLWGLAFKWRSLTGGDDGLAFDLPSLPSTIPYLQTNLIYYGTCSAFLVLLGIAYRFHVSDMKLKLEGLRSSQPRMEALGYSVKAYQLFAFVISGLVVGVAGMMFVVHTEFVRPVILGIGVSAKIMLIVILGGAGTFWGPVIGAAILVLAEEFVTRWGGPWDLLQGLLFLVVALIAPRGLAGFFNNIVPGKMR